MSLIGAIAALTVKEMKIRNFDVWKAVILGNAIETKRISNAAAKKHFSREQPGAPDPLRLLVFVCRGQVQARLARGAARWQADAFDDREIH